MTLRRPTADLTEPQRLVLADIEAQGCHLAAVAETAEAPAHAYTVGLQQTYAHPEVVVCGLDEEVAGSLLDALVEEIAGGRRFAAGQSCDGFVRGYPITFRAVHRTRHARWLAAASWAYQDGDFDALQIVWPDKQGRMPWEEGVRAGFRECQPLLDEKDAGTAGT